MTQFVEQLRNQAKWYAQPGHNARDLMDSQLLEKAADEIERLAAKLEAAEKEREIDEQRIADLMADLNSVGHERDTLRIELNEIRHGVAVAHDTIKALRAKIEAMEKQEPYSYIYEYANPIDGSPVWRDTPGYWNAQYPRSSKPLYALPGAQPAQSVPDGWKLVPERVVEMFCGAADNLGDMPISEAWAERWSNEASDLLERHNYFHEHAAPKPETKP